ncbi:MAG: dihydrolipoamide acetyltransferase family protein [bacterium]
MHVDVVMPKMGESIQEGKILRWMKKPGDKIEKDESILEISTDKVDSEIPSPSAGVLTKIVVAEGETVDVGTVIAIIETDAAAAKITISVPVQQGSKEIGKQSDAGLSSQPPVELPQLLSSEFQSDRFYSPLVRSIAKKESIVLAELNTLQGSGFNGRVTKKDILGYLATRAQKTTGAAAGEMKLDRLDMKSVMQKYPPPKYEVRQMDNIQLKMAEHMVRSVHTSPHVQAISECDVTRMVKYRDANAARFEQQEGFKLTYTPFIVSAAIEALKEFPILNSTIEGDKIILKKFIHFGMAVASPNGLIVPVMKNVEEKNFLRLTRAINDIVVRTRSKHLQPDEIQGGTFTLTNYGFFGNIIGIPIINQPQVAILGVGAIKKRAMVLTDDEEHDTIAIRSMVYLTLSFDHRIIDGAIGGQFIQRVVLNLEQFDFSKVF